MKKIIFFLILLSVVIPCTKEVKAESMKFYEAEYIDGIWMNKEPRRGSSTIYYQKARFFRQVGTNDFAYCIEPFNFFEQSATYESTINPDMLSEEQKQRISEIAHFGFGYQNHTDEKWYAITQFMIWQTADPLGEYYFTDSLNGNRVQRFEAEIKEINELIAKHHIEPSIANKTYYIVENEQLILTDTNQVLSDYYTTDPNIQINNNQLTIHNLTEGNYTITLEKQNNLYNKPIIFYQSPTSQALVETGDLATKNSFLTINVKKTKVEFEKKDKDNNTTIPQGEGKLEGAIYQLYDENKTPLTTIEIEEKKNANIENLAYGKYYLKEIKSGTGYELDSTTYSFELTEENPQLKLTLYNKIIEATIQINKTYGTINNTKPEIGIQFEIWNHKNELVDIITTNAEGKAEIILPYGHYKIKQKTTTPGYQKVKEFEININSKETQIYNLTDYKIKVPDTKNSIIKIIIKIIKGIINRW